MRQSSRRFSQPKGIEANLVAVNTDMQYTLTEVATPNFDHAIVYVPEIDQYLDPTASLLAFGSLPFSLGGKPVLNIDKGTMVRSSRAFVRTLHADDGYAIRARQRWHAPSPFVLSGTGQGAVIGPFPCARSGNRRPANTAQQMIEQAGLKGSGDYSFPNPRELSDNYAITATFHIS